MPEENKIVGDTDNGFYTENKMQFDFRYNKRIGEDNFKATYFCSSCDTDCKKFNALLIKMPNSNIYVCKTCLDETLKAWNIIFKQIMKLEMKEADKKRKEI